MDFVKCHVCDISGKENLVCLNNQNILNIRTKYLEGKEGFEWKNRK